MKAMRVLIVDDHAMEVQEVIDTLRSTGLFDVVHYPNYSSLGSCEEEIRAAVAPFDLLDLDILMNVDSDPFVAVVSAIAGIKPFIAYTQLRESFSLRAGANSFEEVRKFVFSRGALGLITK